MPPQLNHERLSSKGWTAPTAPPSYRTPMVALPHSFLWSCECLPHKESYSEKREGGMGASTLWASPSHTSNDEKTQGNVLEVTVRVHLPQAENRCVSPSR